MKYLLLITLVSICISCGTTNPNVTGMGRSQIPYNSDPKLTKSLFEDKSSTISEENIQKILEGNYQLPDSLRVSFVQIEDSAEQSYLWNNEDYIKSKQSYLDLLSAKFQQSARVQKVLVIPDMLVSQTPTFTNIREAAVRTQADIVAIYSIDSDLYANYKFFSKTEMKAFATTQFLILDVRTGLIPFSKIVTKEYQSQKEKKDFNSEEALNRIKNEAVLLTLESIGDELEKFLAN